MPHVLASTSRRPYRHQPAAPGRIPRGDWLPLLAFFGLLALLSLLHRASAVSVTLVVDGEAKAYTTHAGTVGQLLVEQAVALAPGDLVLPGPDIRLADGGEVTVQHARPVRVEADGRRLDLRSHGRSAMAVLAEAGVVLEPGDRVTVNGRIWPLDRAPRVTKVAQLAGLTDRSVSLAPSDDGSGAGPLLPGDAPEWEIEVLRAVPVTVVEDGVPFPVRLSGPTLADGLAAAGIVLYPEDELTPPPETLVDAGLRVTIHRATPFAVEVDGERREARARADTVAEALALVGVDLSGRDYTDPPAEAALAEGALVSVVRVTEEVLVDEVEIPFETVTQADSALPLDEQREVQAGAPGLKTQTTRITYENGVETARVVEDEVVEREPVQRIVAYGTQVTWNTVDTPAGPKRYWRKLRVYATSYSPARSGTSPSAPWYGRSRLGMVMRRGIVAVDPRLIPLSTNLYVPGYGVGIAGDTGGGIRNYHIDLGFADHDYE
jgi:uncharacterized protein YabE (DUF348 family)